MILIHVIQIIESLFAGLFALQIPGIGITFGQFALIGIVFAIIGQVVKIATSGGGEEK
ncbi:MAG: hypothetical protein QXI16_03735 [Sulfolobaceae archaeon]